MNFLLGAISDDIYKIHILLMNRSFSFVWVQLHHIALNQILVKTLWKIWESESEKP